MGDYSYGYNYSLLSTEIVMILGLAALTGYSYSMSKYSTPKNRTEEQLVKDSIVREKVKHILTKMGLYSDITSRGIRFWSSTKGSRTINKTNVYLCLYPQFNQETQLALGITDYREFDKMYDDNTIVHILLHEIAHVYSNDYDDHYIHGPTKKIFDKLLRDAELVGIFNPEKTLPTLVCGE